MGSLKKMRFSIILFFAFIGFALTAPLQSDDKSDVATKNDIDGTVKKEDNKGETVKEDSESTHKKGVAVRINRWAWGWKLTDSFWVYNSGIPDIITSGP